MPPESVQAGRPSRAGGKRDALSPQRGIIFVRLALLLMGALLGYGLGRQYTGLEWAPAVGALFGLSLAGVAVWCERSLSRASLRAVVAGGLGLLVGLVAAAAAGRYASAAFPEEGAARPLLLLLLHLALGYLGLMVGLAKKEELGWFAPRPREEALEEGWVKVLDTSVVIDGRIADICEGGFLDGILMIPQFVLKELQHIADSSDPLKRNRGRRGLDILQRMQKNDSVGVEISDLDFPRIREVDAKLVALAKHYRGKVVTNDFNLNKVAELQGVPVLNINRLANAMKPVVLPGEELSVYVLKEGKEYGQGVAYLEDGTMVVVDHAKKFIGRQVEVAVTSVLQTTAGRMIFTRLKEEAEPKNGD
ncbi:MAG: PIN/TRAM domain-containing protein [Nitrospinota bacterium]